MRVYIGYDPRDHLAYKVCAASLLDNASSPDRHIEVVKLVERDMRQQELFWRGYRVDGMGQMWDDLDGKPFSTQFSFTRFLVPALERYRPGHAVFCDADFMWRGDIWEMIDGLQADKALWCVKHEQNAVDGSKKMDGVLQTAYSRKNWSSLMVFDPMRNRALTPYKVSLWKGSQLHGLEWLSDDDIGGIPETWNWLEGYSKPMNDPKAVHHTRGTPDMVADVAYADEWWDWVAGRKAA